MILINLDYRSIVANKPSYHKSLFNVFPKYFWEEEEKQ